MDRTRMASDKIRPFLEAMERSIDQVRSKRLQESGEVAPRTGPGLDASPGSPGATGTPGVNGQAGTHGQADPSPGTNGAPSSRPSSTDDSTMIGRSENPASGQNPEQGDGENKPPQRLKAKPKRPSAFTNSPYDRDNYHSQAG